MTSLKHKTISGIKWTAFSSYAQKGLSVVTFIILARLLDPQAFGLFAMAFIVIDGLSLFRNLGIDSALIQRKKDVEVAAHTVFWMMPLLGIFIFIILYLAAPFASLMMKETDLTPILRTLGLIFVLTSIENVPTTLLNKDLRFKELAVREFVSSFLYSIFAIIFAYFNFGVWSLVYAYLLRRVSMLVFSWSLSKYRPRFVFDKTIAKELFHFGKYIFGSSVTGFLSSNVDQFFIGRMLGAATLGYYALAFNLSNIIMSQLANLINRVMFPACSKLQDDKDALKRVNLKFTKVLSFIALPFAVVLIFLSKELVNTLYGPKWLPMVPVLTIFAIFNLFLPIFPLAGPMFLACGKSKWDFMMGLGRLVIMAVIVPIMIFHFGLIGGVIGVVFARLILIPVGLKIMKNLANISLRDIGITMGPAFLSSCFLTVFIFLAKLYFPFGSKNMFSIISFGFLLSALAGVYLFICYILDRNFLKEIRGIVFKV